MENVLQPIHKEPTLDTFYFKIGTCTNFICVDIHFFSCSQTIRHIITQNFKWGRTCN